MSGSESTKDPSYQVLERTRPSLTNHRNLAYNILKYLKDEMVRDKEISNLGLCFECTNDILALPLKAFTVLSCGHLYHRFCIEKKLMITRSDMCPFPDCGKKVDIIYPVSTSARRGSQSSQSSGTSALSNWMGEKFSLISPILEDLMEEIEDTSIQRLFCAKCSEEITVDFPKDTVFLSCKHVVHYDCIDNPRKKCPTCPIEDSRKKRTSTSTEESSSKKKKTSDKEGNSAMLKKLIKKLKDDSINQELSFSTQSPEDSYTHLYKEIVKAEIQSDTASQRILLCYFQFGKKISERVNYYKNEKKYRDRMVQSKVDKEIKEQLSEEVNDTTRWKQTERARKIYELFIEIGIEKMQRVKSYSALTILKLSWVKINYIIDSFRE